MHILVHPHPVDNDLLCDSLGYIKVLKDLQSQILYYLLEVLEVVCRCTTLQAPRNLIFCFILHVDDLKLITKGLDATK